MRPHDRWLILLLLPACAVRGLATDVRFRVEDQKHEPVADAVVSFIPLDRPAPPPTTDAAGAEIEQHGQEFVPLVTVVRRGATVHLPNRDTVEHHVYSQSPVKRFEFPLYAPGRAESVVFDQPGVVALGCNIHDWMLAYVVVVDTPWFGQSAGDGAGRVGDVPPGRYRAELWHRRLGSLQRREITVGATAEPLTFSITLKPDRRIRRPAASDRSGYR